jgi:2'-5' RNA ligase
LNSSIVRSQDGQPVTTEVGEFKKSTEGYIVIIPIPEETVRLINEVQQKIADRLPDGSLWLPEGEQLHVTFAHIISPDAEYASDRTEIFHSIRPQTEYALTHIGSYISGQVITFNELVVFPAAIILRGTDNGFMNESRNKFERLVPLPSNTRKPPTIDHITIARFRKPLDLAQVEAAAPDITFHSKVQVDKLQLIQEHNIYAQKYTVLSEYS